MKQQRKAKPKTRVDARVPVTPRSAARRPYRSPRIVTCESAVVQRLIQTWSVPRPGQALRTP